MRLISLLILPIFLAGCVPQGATEPTDPDSCNAAGYQGLVGQPRQVLDQMQLPAYTRIIGPQDAVTMDYRPERMNIEIADNGRIAKLACY